MPSANVVAAIRDLVRKVKATPLAFPRDDGSRYEILAFLKSYESARRLGAVVTLLPDARVLWIRGSPGSPKRYFSRVQIAKWGRTFQIWNGLEVSGAGMKHEVDIGVYRVRDLFDLPTGDSQDLKIAVECKHYTSHRNLKPQARALVGATRDFRLGNGRGRGPMSMLLTTLKGGVRGDIESFLERHRVCQQYDAVDGPGLRSFGDHMMWQLGKLLVYDR
jgi:hypothetical protein